LEKHFETFKDADLDTLITHALHALKGTTGENMELTSKNASISVVGSDRNYDLLEGEKLEKYLSALENDTTVERQDDVDDEVMTAD
jgi:20S proteasome subunit alpha 6